MAELKRSHEMHRVSKVWGEEQWIINTDKYCGKRMTLNRGWQCSLHRHEVKDETFYVLNGKVRFELGDEVYILGPGDSVHVPTGVKHRFGGIERSVMMEFSTHHDDADTYRDEGEDSRYNTLLLEAAE